MYILDIRICRCQIAYPHPYLHPRIIDTSVMSSRVPRGKTPRFTAKYFFSLKLSEIFTFFKVHIFAKLLGHILKILKILFPIWEFSYPNICSRKKYRASCPLSGVRHHPLRDKTPYLFTWTYIGITKFLDLNFFLNVPQEFGKNVNFQVSFIYTFWNEA